MYSLCKAYMNVKDVVLIVRLCHAAVVVAVAVAVAVETTDAITVADIVSTAMQTSGSAAQRSVIRTPFAPHHVHHILANHYS